MERDRKRSKLSAQEELFDQIDHAEQRNTLLKKMRNIEKENAAIAMDIQMNSKQD